MPEPIRVGTVFIDKETALPTPWECETEPYADRWRTVKNLNGYELDRKLRLAGWTLFDLARVGGRALGFDREKSVRGAVDRLLAKTQADDFNALEISEVIAKRFLGLPYVTVYGRIRHIQESMFLLHDKQLAKRNQAKLAYSRAASRS